ncbi:MAG TPA: PKD domain-containing protein, partial [Candidatus Angelobacter sp.]
MNQLFNINRNRAQRLRQILTRIGCLLLFAAMLVSASISRAQTVSADFGGRTASTPVVPKGLFAVNGVGSTLSDTGAINTLTSAGLDGTRFWIEMDQVYAKSTPDFSYLDRYLTTIQNTGLHPIAVMFGTPPSLGAKACSVPSNISQWGQMAATVVAHIDQKFPGVIQDYEIWNEPENTASLCPTGSTSAMKTYVSLYAAAAPAMHAQAQADNQTIRTGGPVMADMTQVSTWFPALLNNASTAPYVDFVSFHIYLTGQNDINNGMQWPDLYAATQGSTNGLIHYYNLIDSLVRAGKQPNAASTPIYVSEFNTNWAYAVDHLRNDPSYGPLWNSLAISDFLNVGYNGATALPSRLAYFKGYGQYFCLLGQWNTDMDCNPATTDPYPQFYAFKLFAAPNYLNLQAGAKMASWVSPGSTKAGLSATAFYTDSADNIVIINPTSTAYKAVPVSINNPGITSATGTMYLLNSSNSQITTGSLTLSSSGSTYNTTVDVPAYSTVAVSLTGTISPTTVQATPPPPPPAPVPPVPVLNVTTTSTPLMVNVDTSASQGGNGDAITGRTISFGDGTSVNWVATTTHTYAKAGTYTVSVSLKNEDNLTANASKTVTVTTAAAPVPALNVTPTSGTAPLVVTIDSSASQGGGSSTITGRTIDFGDGTPAGSAATTTHTYTTPGSYTVNLTLTNQAGLKATASSVVTVTAPAATAPVPALNVTPISGTAPLVVTIDATASQGGSSKITGRTIEFGDGTWVTWNPTATHTYTNPGSYTVRLTLKNADGLTATKTSVVTVTAPLPPPPATDAANTAPTPVLNVTPTSTPLTV